MVCFVDDADFDITEVTVTLLDEIGQPPGQATTMSVRARRAATCRLCGLPPNTVTTLSPIASARGTIAAWTWLASSRVGTSTRPRGRHAIVWPPARTVTSGIANASVLPEPVRPRPSTSRPASASGSVMAWIGNGVVMPVLASAAVTSRGTPRDANVTTPGWPRCPGRAASRRFDGQN